MAENASSTRLKKWRLILGKAAQEEPEGPPPADKPADEDGDPDATGLGLTPEEQGMDDVLEALYQEGREGSLGPSSPNVNRWLGDIRTYFPRSVVRILQQDALHRLGLERMLLEPELLQKMQPDVHLVASLLSLRQVLPDQTRETARMLVRRVAEEVERKWRPRLEQAVRGSRRHAARHRRPSLREIDWHRTIRANLRHYQPEWRTVVPEQLIGYRRRRPQMRDILLLLDLSGSMAGSAVYAGILACVLASLPALRIRLIGFDTAIADMTDQLDDPVDLLFGLNLGGGTDIGQALAYARQYIERPADTTVFLISDLYEGRSARQVTEQAARVVQAGAGFITLLALDDKGTPSYDVSLAEKLARLGIPAFATTPDLFADLLGDVLAGKATTRPPLPRASAD